MRANYSIENADATSVTLRDLGPWDRYQTITNDAENVVKEVFPHLSGRKLYYIDSEGQTDELLVKDGEFAGFNLLR